MMYGMTDLPKFIRATHPSGFRSGEWAQVVACHVVHVKATMSARRCWLVVVPDGATDSWVCEDPSDRYEFADAVPA
jgi:hypothetical protein